MRADRDRGDTTHRLLVTSRHTLPVPHARRIEVDVLPPADSVAVLTDALRAASDATIDLLALYAAARCLPEERPAAIDGLLDFYRSADITDIERPNFVAVTVLAATPRHDTHVLDLAAALFPYSNRRRHWLESITVNECGVQAARQLGDRAQESYCLARLGATYRHMRRWDTAEEWLRRGLAHCQETGDRLGEGMTLTGLGNLYRDLHRHPEALDHFTKALAVRQAAKDEIGEAITLRGIANTYVDLGHIEAALKHYRPALHGFKQANSPETPHVQTLINALSQEANPPPETRTTNNS